MEITQDLVKNMFDYVDGNLIRKQNSLRNVRKAGEKAGYIHNHDGYVRICIAKKQYMAHRLIFLMFHGFMPRYIDHIDLNRSNNKIENLRQANWSQNNSNKNVRKDSKTGVKGVIYLKKIDRYWSRINVDGKMKHLGHFKNIDDAAKAYQDAARKIHKEYARW